MGDINQYRCIHLADYRENDKLCRAIERIKELEKEYDKLAQHFINNHIPKSKIRKILEKQYELFNSKNQKEYSQEVVDVLEELLMEDK